MYKRKMKLSPIHNQSHCTCHSGIIAVIVTFAVRNDETKEPAAQSGIVYDDAAIEGGWDNLSPEEIAERLNQKVEEGMINISMNTAPYFENGTAEGNLMLVNESINNYPQKVQIVRNDTGEQIYESGAIAVGSKIERAKLDVVLPAVHTNVPRIFTTWTPKPVKSSARPGQSSTLPSKTDYQK